MKLLIALGALVHLVRGERLSVVEEGSKPQMREFNWDESRAYLTRVLCGECSALDPIPKEESDFSGLSWSPMCSHPDNSVPNGRQKKV